MAMQITQKSGEGLSRVYGVTVPMQDLADKLEAKIAEIRPRMNIKGFRPGKVPTAHVKTHLRQGPDGRGRSQETLNDRPAAGAGSGHQLRVASHARPEAGRVRASSRSLAGPGRPRLRPRRRRSCPTSSRSMSRTLALTRPVLSRSTDEEIDRRSLRRSRTPTAATRPTSPLRSGSRRAGDHGADADFVGTHRWRGLRGRLGRGQPRSTIGSGQLHPRFRGRSCRAPRPRETGQRRGDVPRRLRRRGAARQGCGVRDRRPGGSRAPEADAVARRHRSPSVIGIDTISPP